MTEFNFGTKFTEDMVKLLVCIATSNRGWTEEQINFMKQVEKELFGDD